MGGSKRSNIVVAISWFIVILLFSILTKPIIIEAQVAGLNKASGVHAIGVRIVSPKANATVVNTVSL
jgi:hypothetical protein